jgi:NADPH-dependent 2,4-dienoyl-CoA reductase/sulfur reductase-like enzyme
VVDNVESLVAKNPQELYEEHNITVKTDHAVEEIDLEKARIRIRQNGDAGDGWEPFDLLMIATGALPIRPPIDGIDAKGIFGINTLQSGLDLMAYLEENQPKEAVVIGGGYIGLEMAENLLLRGMDVSLVERAPEVMGTLDTDMGAKVSEALIRMGVHLYREESLEAFETEHGYVKQVVTDQRRLPAGIVVLGMGVKPNVSLAQEAGIRIGESGAIAVDDTMHTDAENVWAGGDCAESFHLISRRPVNIALGTVANKHGRVAGTNMGGGYAVFPGLVGTAVSKICEVEVARTGLQEKEIHQTGRAYVSAVAESSTRAGYYPDAGSISVKILAEKGNGKLLGAQIVGKEGAAKRIDILATALHAGLTVEEVAELDLSYAPPYSPVWDPVAIAARLALKRVTDHQ